MLALNIFRLIGDLFGLILTPFKWLRLELAKTDGGWWTSNLINWLFLVILIILLGYWMAQSLKFKREGTEDKA